MLKTPLAVEFGDLFAGISLHELLFDYSLPTSLGDKVMGELNKFGYKGLLHCFINLNIYLNIFFDFLNTICYKPFFKVTRSSMK